MIDCNWDEKQMYTCWENAKDSCSELVVDCRLGTPYGVVHFTTNMHIAITNKFDRHGTDMVSIAMLFQYQGCWPPWMWLFLTVLRDIRLLCWPSYLWIWQFWLSRNLALHEELRKSKLYSSDPQDFISQEHSKGKLGVYIRRVKAWSVDDISCFQECSLEMKLSYGHQYALYFLQTWLNFIGSAIEASWSLLSDRSCRMI